MPTFTTRLALQQPVGGDPVSEFRIAITANSVILDSAVLYSQGTLAARPVSTVGTPGVAGRRYLATDQTPSPGVEFFDYGTGWLSTNAADQASSTPSLRTLGTGANQAAAGNDSRFSKTVRHAHTYTSSSLVSPDVAGTIVGSFFADPAASETITLVEAVIHCVTVGATPSVFKVQTDIGSHGTLTDLAGLTGLTPSTSQTAVTPSGSVTLTSLDRVCVVVVTAGNSLGCTIDIKTAHAF